MATSAPVPMAMPTSALASAGASLMPSPAIATTAPLRCRSSIKSSFSSGRRPARTSSMPSCAATALAVVALSPVAMTILSPSAWSRAIASALPVLIGSATATKPASLPSAPSIITVSPLRRRFSAASANGAASMPAPCISRALPSSTARPSTLPLTPWPVTASKSSTLGGFRPVRFGAAEDRLGKGMLAAGFERSRQAQYLARLETGAGLDARQRRLAFRQGAGLVDHQRVDRGEALKRRGVTDQHAGLCARVPWPP